MQKLRDENRERHEKSGIEKVAVADGGRGITDGAGVGCEGEAHRRTPRLVVLHRLPRKGRGGRRDTAGAGAAPQEPGHRRRGGAPPPCHRPRRQARRQPCGPAHDPVNHPNKFELYSLQN